MEATKVPGKKALLDRFGRYVYGPYVTIKMRYGKPLPPRRHVILLYGEISKKAKRKNMSYARWQMEQHLGRYLLPGETVDHGDENTLNDSLSNYQILTHAENCQKHVAKAKAATELPITGAERIGPPLRGSDVN
jgi:hypothetical protein